MRVAGLRRAGRRRARGDPDVSRVVEAASPRRVVSSRIESSAERPIPGGETREHPLVKTYTPRQRAILQFIADYQKKHGVSPTLEEIGAEFGVHRVTIFQHVNALMHRGAIRRTAQLARSIEILDTDFQPN